jgi:hypothetical protein
MLWQGNPAREMTMTKRMSEDDSGLYSGFTSPTVKITSVTEDRVQETVPYTFAEPKTRMYRGPGEPENAAELPENDPMQDPCVGHLFITEGRGCGAALKLGYGRNSIGRGTGERVCLNYGDTQISSNQHACLLCDPISLKSYLEPGKEARNLTYIEREGRMEPVLMPIQLNMGDVFMVGRTKLKFWPFDHDWQAKP